MKPTRKWLQIFALVAVTATLVPPSSQARTGPQVAETRYESAAAPPSQDSAVGAGAAMGCGAGLRAVRFGLGANPYIAIATVILCMIMIVDGAGS
jgi:hypothetical protein